MTNGKYICIFCGNDVDDYVDRLFDDGDSCTACLAAAKEYMIQLAEEGGCFGDEDN